MGGSSVVRPRNGQNCYLSMRGKNGKWMQCKAQELEELWPPNPLHLEKGKYFRWHFMCSPLFNEFYDLFYKNGRKVVKLEVLDSFRAIALMVWFVDAGNLVGGKAVINTRSFGKEGTKTIAEYFKLVGLKSKTNNSKVEMDVESTKKFISLIGEYIPEFLLHG